MGHRVAIQTAKTKFSASFLLWGQRQRHTNTDMGSLDCKSADNSSVKKHQEALCILAGCYHGTTYAHVLRRFYRIHGKSRKPGMISLQRRCKSTTRTKSFRLRGLTFEKNKTRSPILRGFEEDFYALLCFTGQQYFGISGNQHGRFYLFHQCGYGTGERPIVGMPMRK